MKYKIIYKDGLPCHICLRKAIGSYDNVNWCKRCYKYLIKESNERSTPTYREMREKFLR